MTLHLRTPWRASAALGLVVVMASCSGTEAGPPATSPVTVAEVSGDDLPNITLSESAAVRLAIKTEVVEAMDGGLVVPSAAVLITTDGSYWVYTNREPLVYQRQEIKPVVEANLQAFYTDGPPAGTRVVVAGVPELYGAETGIGK